jgi:hypothetical protein
VDERVSEKWTEQEIVNAVKGGFYSWFKNRVAGFHQFGKDFHAIADALKSKSERMLRMFYEDNRSKYRLDFVSAERVIMRGNL